MGSRDMRVVMMRIGESWELVISSLVSSLVSM